MDCPKDSDKTANDLDNKEIDAVAAVSIRKQIEEAFSGIKNVAGQDKTKFRGCNRVGWAFIFAVAAYDLVWLPKLIAMSA